jgi:hypothetical protein
VAAINLGTDGVGHGWLEQGWTQEEAASPHVIGDESGETRQTSFSAVATADSDLIVGKDIGITGPFSASGIALESTLVGNRLSTSAYDVDTKFLPVRDFPHITTGFEEAAVDALQRLYGSGGVTLPWAGTGVSHCYYPLRGHQQGYTVDGLDQPYSQNTWGDGVGYDVFGDQSFMWGKAAATASAFIRRAEGVYCTSARLLRNAIHSGSTRVNYQYFNARIAAGNGIRSQLRFDWASSIPSATIWVDLQGTTGTAAEIKIHGTYRVYGTTTATPITPVTVPLTGLSTANEIAMVFQWGFLTSADNATLRLKAYAYDPASPPGGAPTLVNTVDLPNFTRSVLASQAGIVSQLTPSGAVGFRDVLISQNDSWAHHYPVVREPNLITMNFTKTLVGAVDASPTTLSARQSAIHAWHGSGWDYLKMMCSARGLQMKVVGTQLAITDLFPIAGVQPISNVIGEPVLHINAAGRARSIDVVKHATIQSNTFYPASPLRFPGKVTITKQEEQRVVIDLPPGDHLIASITLGGITDTTGRIQTYRDIWNAGFRMTPTVDVDGKLTLIIRGPSRENVTWLGGSYTGYSPWTVEEIVVGLWGSVEADESITLYTGAPEDMVTRDKGGNVDNPFLCTVADVFDRSSWLISSEGSPMVTLDVDVPSSHRSRYAVGQVVSYGWGHFRVMNVQHSKASTKLTCHWFATQAQQSANWAGQTAAQWNTFWSGKRAYDVFLRPLASSVPVVNPEPFIRVYPSESTNPV